MDLWATLRDIGLQIVRDVGIPWLQEQYGDEWRQIEQQVQAVTDPIFAMMVQALQFEGLLKYVIGDAIPDEGISRRIWEIRRPFDAQATQAMAFLGLTRKGNPQ
jgi:hypothetical protein